MSDDKLVTALSVTDALLKEANNEQLAEALRMVSLMVAEHERVHGKIPMDRLLNKQTTDYLDPDVEDSIVNGLTILAGALGSVTHTSLNDWDWGVH